MKYEKDEAIALYKSDFWESLTFEERAKFQMAEERLCMPFDIFHEAIEKTFGRSVYTHEFGLNRQGLINELFDGAGPPTTEEIINMIPKEKRIVIFPTGPNE